LYEIIDELADGTAKDLTPKARTSKRASQTAKDACGTRAEQQGEANA
jgi:hypothetical protein